MAECRRFETVNMRSGEPLRLHQGSSTLVGQQKPSRRKRNTETMKQIVQSTGKGHLSVLDVPMPQPGPTDVLVETQRSLVSSGTERAIRELAQSSLLKKAQERPDLVKQVLNRLRSDGLRATFGAVRDKMEAVTPLGYSAAGIVVATGENAPMFRPGTRVATASAGHAEMQVVPGLLTVPIPDSVTDEAAAFGAVAAIAMHSLHQSELMVGDTVVVAGLGLVGQLTTRLAVAAGLKVIGVDLQPSVVKLAQENGALAVVERGDETTAEIIDLAGGKLPDVAIITASTSSSDPVMRACERVRDRGRVVVVGDVGLDIDRTPFYVKEVDLRFARSYGAGRYDPRFEQMALDYPEGYVPRTQRTNIAAYLDLVARKRLDVGDLVTRVYDVSDASAAYDELGSNPDCLAIQFSYPGARTQTRSISLSDESNREGSVALIGTGEFVRSTLLPAMRSTQWGDIAVVASEGGLNAWILADRARIPQASSNVDDILKREDIGTVFIATRHDSHSHLITDALLAEKDVFCEKPLAIDQRGFDSVVDALNGSERSLWMGFNRRYSPAVVRLQEAIAGGTTPLSVHYRVAAGKLPDTHWMKDVRQGGRLQGEVCHFVDTASWIIDSRPVSVVAVGRSSASPVLQEDVVLLVSYEDGSTATIEYITDAHRSTVKERIQVMGRGHTIVVDDFEAMTCDGQELSVSGSGKGHIENLVAFRKSASSRTPDVRGIRTSLSTTQTMFAAIESMSVGESILVGTISVL